MSERAGRPILRTRLPGVELRPLRVADAAPLHRLVASSRGHLLRFGNYRELVSSPLAERTAELADLPDRDLRRGIWVERRLAGRVDLTRVAVGTFVLGYWLGREFTGRGLATEACRSLLDHARCAYHARDFWAGVTHGNAASMSVLRRLGFHAVERLPDRMRFHRHA